MLAFLGFTDKDKCPTDIWSRFVESEDYALILGEAVLAAYDALFGEHSDAAELESKVLMIYFSDNSDVSGQESAYVTLTFKVLCDLSEFPVPTPEVEEKIEDTAPEEVMQEIIDEEVIEELQAFTENQAEEIEDKEAIEEIELRKEPDITVETEPVIPQEESGTADHSSKKKIRISICIDIDDDLNDDPDLKEKLLTLINNKLTNSL